MSKFVKYVPFLHSESSHSLPTKPPHYLCALFVRRRVMSC
jgi:hypothetical protein